MERTEKFDVEALKTKKPRRKLKRILGFWQASICGIGIILGAGIYALIGVAAGQAGPALWLGFLVAGIIAMLTGLSYAELSSVFKKDSAEYDYVRKAFNKKLALLLALTMLLAALFTSATVALGFGGYLASLLGTNVLISAIVLVLILTAINFSGIKQSVFINTIFTIIEAGGLLFIIVIGIKYWGSVNLLEMPNGLTGVFNSAALVFFSYIGFQSIVKLSEETKSPTKNIPRAVLFSVAFSTVIYVLVAISAVSILDWQVLSTSSSPLADVARAGLGSSTFIVIGIIALFSTTNTVLMDIVTTSRMIYGMARRNVFPARLGEVHSQRGTPHFAVYLVCFITIIFALIGDIEKVASLGNFFTFITFGIVNFSVIRLRWTYTGRRPFKVPGQLFGVPILPLLGGILSFGMLYFVVPGIL